MTDTLPLNEAPSSRRRPQLSDEVASYVRELILSGRLAAGEYLRLDRLAADLGMSSTPVREGLLLLRGEGFLQLEPRRGFVVVPLTEGDISDMYAVQADVAGELAARAATRLSDADLDSLRKLQSLLEDAARQDRPDDVERLNHAVHRTINRAAASPKLSWFLSVVVRYTPRRFFATITGWPEASLHDHGRILAALAERDADAAREAMRAHILHAGALLTRHLAGPGAARGETKPG